MSPTDCSGVGRQCRLALIGVVVGGWLGDVLRCVCRGTRVVGLVVLVGVTRVGSVELRMLGHALPDGWVCCWGCG